ncbi:MAG: hypothetical protein LBC74_09155 [Planctomycetaceae bacterium]|nr:hypothetical protein [Planctomycetaceae bacterium]
MTNENDNLELEPIEDELELEPIEDDDANKQIAPDIPFNAGVRLIPVICSACKTRLYAGEDQVGLWKRCPDCYRLTEIRAVPPRFILTADDPEAAGGYNIKDAEVSKQDIARLKTENLNAFEADQKSRNFIEPNDRVVPSVNVDEPPVIEGVLNKLLKSNEEKNEEYEIIRREKRIENEVEAVKIAARSGKLDEYLASTKDNQQKTIDPAERKRIEKQRQFDAATYSSLSSLSTSTSKSSTPVSPRFTPPPPPPTAPTSTTTTLSKSVSTQIPSTKKTSLKVSGRVVSELSGLGYSSGSLWFPLFDKRCRARLIILTICGLIGNLMGENARSMIWQASIDKVYDKMPGYVYNWAESGFLFINFWIGMVLSIIWVCMLFLFGISLFDAAVEGKDRVESWIPFNLDFGISYIGWSFLILFISGFPGFVVWHIFGFFLPDWEPQLIIIHYVGQFFCFPILFLCVIESDTFYGNFPRKTLTSLYKYPIFWLKLYFKAAFLAGIPILIIIGLMFTGTVFFEHWFMHSVYYYVIASVLLTFGGYFVLFYFRLLGKAAWEIEQKEKL